VTGFSPEVRDIITDRAGGMVSGTCERCDETLAYGVEIHHRRARGMGSTKRRETNLPANGVAVCPQCHRCIESNRTDALADGWLIRQTVDPSTVPLIYRGRMVLLDNFGGVIEQDVSWE
jgi:5-methylcytosine-specific restriction enzyme A